MTYLLPSSHGTASAGSRFRALIAGEEIFQLPGVHSGLAALQAKRAGFVGGYLSGAAMSASMGLPDLGIIGLDDVLPFIRQIVGASELPLMVDGDTGYGEALNVMRMVRAFEEAGAAAVHIEDQRLPKKCGHLNDKRLVTPDEMALKVAAAAKARSDLVIVARTDAATAEGIEGVVARAKLYMEAGADAIFPEALTDAAMFQDVARALPGVPLLANMTEFGRSPALPTSLLQQMGYAMVIWPVSSLRVAAKAQEDLYAAIKNDGGTANVLDRMLTRAELYDLIGLRAYEDLDQSIVATVLPA